MRKKIYYLFRRVIGTDLVRKWLIGKVDYLVIWLFVFFKNSDKWIKYD